MNLAEVKASYSKEKREDAKAKDPWAHYVARPLSFYPAWLCIKLGITANQVTIAGLFVGLGGCFLIEHGYFILGAVFVNIYGMADYVDGDIARANHTESEYGSRIDGVGYLLMVSLLFICVGVGLDSYPYLLLGFLASHARILRYALSAQAQLSPEGGGAGFLTRFGMAMIGVREPLLLICAIANRLDVFLIFYALINACELFVILFRIMGKGKVCKSQLEN